MTNTENNQTRELPSVPFNPSTSPTLTAARLLVSHSLKSMLRRCTEEQVLLFKSMYSHKNLDASISEVVDNIPEEKIGWAVCQVENALKK